MLRRQSPSVLNQYFRILVKYSNSDSSLITEQPKLKSIIDGDFKRAKKKEFQPHFVERLFLNKFQYRVLEYPQIDALEDVSKLQTHARIVQKLLTGGNEGEVPLLEDGSKEAVSSLKKHELVGFKVPHVKNGFGYLQSEYTFMQETLAADPSLSKTVCEQEDFGIYLIDKFGTDLQKNEYLAKLISGESIASFATIEKETLVSFLQNSCSTSAELLSDNDSYAISGTKCWVYNAKHADVFIVSAIIKSKDEEVSQPTLFLINKNTLGVEIHEPIDKIGLKKLSICDVTFNNAVVPKSAILGSVHKGNKVVEDVLSQGKLSNGGHCIGIMKKFLNKAIKHCITNDFYQKSKTESNYFICRIADMASQLYAVESMTYLMTGRIDTHDNPDAFVESLIVKVFASETLQFMVRQTLEILGPDFFSDENKDLLDLTKDSQFYVACDDANDFLRLILSSAGLKYANYVRKNSGLLELFSNFIHEEKTMAIGHTPDSMNFTKEAEGYVHPVFAGESRVLEDGIYNLGTSARYLLKTYKDDVHNRHFELKILADMVIDVYTMVATLARSSRAYCIGVKNFEFDRLCAECVVRSCSLRLRENRFLLRRPEEFISLYTEVAPTVMDCNKYSDFCSVLKSLTIR